MYTKSFCNADLDAGVSGHSIGKILKFFMW